MAKWYLTRDGKEFGPLTSQQLRTVAAKGGLRPDSLVRREDMNAPRPAREIRGLLPETSAAQMEHPPKAQPAPELGSPDPPSLAAWMPKTPIHLSLGAAGIVAMGLLFLCCGGLSGGSGELSLPVQTEGEIRRVVLQRNPDEVIAAIGQPDWVAGTGRFEDGRRYQEAWRYMNAVVHRPTGRVRRITIFFNGGRVVETEVR